MTINFIMIVYIYIYIYIIHLMHNYDWPVHSVSMSPHLLIEWISKILDAFISLSDFGAILYKNYILAF
jgi:hypothetical protein